MNNPIGNPAFAAAFRRACPPEPTSLAVAVSGGADSMALLLLLRNYTDERGIPLTAVTVDHGLRAESAEEAAQVASWCSALGVDHHILTWHHPPLQSGIPGKAREARYSLMSEWCLAREIRHLCTAHHLDDQIETLLMRLVRGSPLETLAGILPSSQRLGLTLLRPLLGFTKQQLLATLAFHKHDWIEDPSNQKPDYRRNTIRAWLNSLPSSQKERISHITDYFLTFRIQCDNYLSSAYHDCVEWHEAGYAFLDHSHLLSEPPLVQQRIAAHLCAVISGNASPLRGEQVDRLHLQLRTPVTGKKAMLGGAVFSYQHKTAKWLVFREAKRIQAAPARPHPFLWDGRYLMSGADSDTHVAPLEKNYLGFRKQLSQTDIPKAVWPSLPAFFRLEECIAIPHIHWKVAGVMHDLRIESVASKQLGQWRDSAAEQAAKTKGERIRA